MCGRKWLDGVKIFPTFSYCYRVDCFRPLPMTNPSKQSNVPNWQKTEMTDVPRDKITNLFNCRTKFGTNLIEMEHSIQKIVQVSNRRMLEL